MESEHLIEIVKLRPALWNQQDKAHHNRYILEKLWNEVAFEMKQPRKAVRDKWKNLRDMYRKEFHKTRRASSKDAPANESESYWPHFNSLSFLKNQFVIRVVEGNVIQSIMDNQSTNEFTDEESLIDDSNDTNIVSAQYLDKELKNVRSTTSEILDSQTDGIKRNVKHFDGKTNAEKKKLKILETDCSVSGEKVRDDDEDFLFSMLPFMKELPLAEKLLCRIRMQEVLFNLLFKKSPIENNTTFQAKPPPPYGDPFSIIGNTVSSILPAFAQRPSENSD